jgi:hypothetical protein
MTTDGKTGFHYHLEDDVIRRYRAKPLELRLAWLYMGAVLRKACPERTRRRHDYFRLSAEEESAGLDSSDQ